MDLYIEALARLNWQLKQMTDPPTVVAFIITKAPVRSINVGALQSQSMFEDLRNTCSELQEQMGDRLFKSAAAGKLPTYGELLPEDSQVRLKRALHAWRTNRQPSIVTHDLWDDADDPVLKHLRYRGLFNAADDPVKVIFHPEFVTATSPFINLDYEHFVRGCHMGIFPGATTSLGVTRRWSASQLGVPAGDDGSERIWRICPGKCSRPAQEGGIPGIMVINRRTSSFDASTDSLVSHLVRFAQLQRRERIEMRNRVSRAHG